MPMRSAMHENRGLSLEEGTRACVDAIRHEGITTSKIDALGMWFIRTVAVGGIWTEDRLLREGYCSDGRCPLCGQLDSVYHRAWHCPHLKWSWLAALQHPLGS